MTKGKSDTKNHPHFLIVTGLSGAGKSTVIKALEDMGYYCVDNLPISLMKTFAQLCLQSSQPMDKVALGIDIRERERLKDLPHIMDDLKQLGMAPEILFLHAKDEVLINRFKETRRPHPLQTTGSLEASIALERKIMEPIKAISKYILDTSQSNPHVLKAQIKDLFGTEGEGMLVYIHSFGFKNGVPPNLDILLDVRFLPNPHFVGELREKTGLDPQVEAYVMEHQETRSFLEHLSGLFTFLLPRYEKEGKPFLSVGIGCTGGMHRSVVIARWLGKLARDQGFSTKVFHRELDLCEGSLP